MDISFSNFEFWIGLTIAIITLFTLFHERIIYPVKKLIFGFKLDIIDIRFENHKMYIIFQNNEKRTIIITKVKLAIEQYLLKNEIAGQKSQIEPSEKVYFIIEPYDKILESNISIAIKPDDPERIDVVIKTGSTETRFIEYEIEFYSGNKLCCKTPKILDLINERYDEDFVDLFKNEYNNKLKERMKKSKLIKTDSFHKNMSILK